MNEENLLQKIEFYQNLAKDWKDLYLEQKELTKEYKQKYKKTLNLILGEGTCDS